MEKACRTPRSARRLTAAEVDAFAPTVHDFLNVEVKARCNRIDEVRRILMEAGVEARGIDRQADTYFQAPRGRLKIREGTIENALIAFTSASHASSLISMYVRILWTSVARASG